MRIVDVQQGSDAWRKLRLQHRCASEAPAVMGASKHLRRSDLVRMKALGLEQEFSDYVQQHVLAPGHVAERGSRALVEQQLGEDLYPVTGTTDDGYLWASLDGETMDDTTLFESKRWNEELAAQVRAKDLDAHYYWQLEQELAVAGAERVIFACSDGVPERHLTMEYRPVPGRLDRLLAAWRQFDADVAAFELPPAAAPAPVGKTPESLPALFMQARGEIVDSNIDVFRAVALERIRSVNRSLVTDEDFADADKAQAWCSKVEAATKAAREAVLGQTGSIDAALKVLDDVQSEARTVRLDLEKLTKRRKDERKDEVVAAARRKVDQHIARVNAELAPMMLRPVTPDYAGAVRSKKSIASMESALSDLVAATKIDADAAARAIRANVATFNELATGLEFLFADLGQLVHRPVEDFRTLAEARVTTHKAQEAARAAQRKADEDARVEAAAAQARADEAARIERQQAETLRTAAEERMATAYKSATDRVGHDRPYEVYLSFAVDHARKVPIDKVDAYIQALADLQPLPPLVVTPTPASVPAPAPVVSSALQQIVRATPPAPRADEPATLNLGAINGRLGFTMTSAFVTDTLGIAPAKVDRSVRYYRESQFPLICAALVAHLARVAEPAEAAC